MKMLCFQSYYFQLKSGTQKIFFKVKVLKKFKISCDCQIKTCMFCISKTCIFWKSLVPFLEEPMLFLLVLK